MKDRDKDRSIRGLRSDPGVGRVQSTPGGVSIHGTCLCFPCLWRSAEKRWSPILPPPVLQQVHHDVGNRVRRDGYMSDARDGTLQARSHPPSVPPKHQP